MRAPCLFSSPWDGAAVTMAVMKTITERSLIVANNISIERRQQRMVMGQGCLILRCSYQTTRLDSSVYIRYLSTQRKKRQ
jgi:hypothetical protein